MSVALSLLLALSPAAQAKNLPKQGITLQDVDKLVDAAGLPHERKVFDDGVEVVRIDMDGVKIDAYVLGCDEQGRCADLQLAMGWSMEEPIPLEQVNAWNRSHRYVRAYVNDRGSLWGEIDLTVRPGGTRELVLDYLRFVRTDLLPPFVAHFDL